MCLGCILLASSPKVIFFTGRTVLTVVPEDQELKHGGELIWRCEATSDESTPVTIDWEHDGYPIVYEPGRIEKMDDNALKLITYAGIAHRILL